MRSLIVLIVLACIQSFAWAEEFAQLKLSIPGESDRVLYAELRFRQGQEDPYLCRRVELRLEHALRVEKQVAALSEKILESVSPRVEDLKLLASLEQRLQEDFEFLNQEAPTVLIEWPLVDLAEETIQRLRREDYRYALDSYAVIWSRGEDAVAPPEGTASMRYSRRRSSFSLLLRANVMAFCSRKMVQLELSL